MADKKFIQFTDNELLQLFYAERENEYLGVLLERYTLILFGVCMKYLKDETHAQDAVQQIFVKTIQELQKNKVEYFKSWLYMVAKNYCLMQLRKKGNNVQPLPEFGKELQSHETNREELYLKELSLQKLEKALPQLNTEQQTCINLFYLQNRSYQQIAEETGYAVNQVKSHIQNGKRNLKIIIEKMK